MPEQGFRITVPAETAQKAWDVARKAEGLVRTTLGWRSVTCADGTLTLSTDDEYLGAEFRKLWGDQSPLPEREVQPEA